MLKKQSNQKTGSKHKSPVLICVLLNIDIQSKTSKMKISVDVDKALSESTAGKFGFIEIPV